MKLFFLYSMLLLPIHADVLNLGYTATGLGGLSQAQGGISDNPFWWVDNSADMTTAFPDSLYVHTGGISPLSNPTISALTGSSLLSSPFIMNGGETLDVSLMLMTSDDYSRGDVGYAVLLGASQSPILLYMAVATRGNELSEGEFGTFEQFSPGVTVTDLSSGGTVNAVLGGHDYSIPVSAAFGSGSAYDDFSISYTPGAGRYQLLFGEVARRVGAGEDSQAALAVQSVSVNVPEQGTGQLLVAMLLPFAALALKRAKRARLQTRVCIKKS